MDLMETLAKHASQVMFEDLPPQVVSITKRSVLDTLGVMIGGSSIEGCRLLVDYICDWGGREEGTIAVFGRKAPAALAAQANGAMARVLELDDIIDMFPLHPSASIIPTCLAVAERQGTINGKDFITAVVLGHDLVIRLAMSVKMNPMISGRDNLFMVFALTGSAGKLLGLNEDQLLNAMGIAYSQMVGDVQASMDGVMMTYIQQGTRAKSAIEAALMAQKGITGTQNVLQGQYGFYNAYEPDPRLEVLTKGLGKKFRGEDLAIKFHSACRLTHQAIDLAQMFRVDGITADQIDRITVKVAEECYKFVCAPLEKKRTPRTSVDAQFSIPYVTAATFVRGDVFIDEINEQSINDPEILKLAQRITPVLDPERKTDLVLGSVVMEVKTRSGRILLKKTEFPKGNPRNPVTMEECIKKFRKCVSCSLKPFPQKQLDQIIEVVGNLEQLDNVNQLGMLLVPASR
ncbi:MAG: MmgE/PrpD family protein [Thermodesulfobacteriota bacterium]|jgi:2-methylcitrate dehydratase PrpD